jgi:epoxyqueuosine reductase
MMEEDENMGVEETKKKIRQHVLDMGVDDLGFANVKDYSSPRSPKIVDLFPTARSMIVMVFKEPSNCESPSSTMADLSAG